jgi:hypothetical protein
LLFFNHAATVALAPKTPAAIGTCEIAIKSAVDEDHILYGCERHRRHSDAEHGKYN